MSRLVPFLLAALWLAVTSSPAAAEEFDSLYYNDLGWVAPFEMTDQQGRTVRLEDLRGKVWVASFFFSTCKDCNKKTIPNLQKLQQELAGWPDVVLVSFSVFPEQDTTEQLVLFGEQAQVNPNRWLLLTGARDRTYSLIQESFKQAVGPNREPSPGREILHAFKFMIVDQNGKIRGYVDGTDPDEVERLAHRVEELVLAKYFPSINAGLNALSGILLLLGFAAVRLRWITLHKAFMLAALVVSGLFLACYLYYHFALTHGRPTLFSGPDWARIVYYVVLGTHTLLAIVVAPLALVTTYLGLSNRLRRHMAMARWTLPLWLYVSATGVVVYWMLYHLYPPSGP
jgi:protein SCO1/2/putative membrane protein